MTTLPPNDPRHGTVNGYQNHRCRCQPCTEARRRYDRAKRLRGLNPGDPRHGWPSGYFSFGCRCDLCADAASSYWRRSRRRRRHMKGAA